VLKGSRPDDDRVMKESVSAENVNAAAVAVGVEVEGVLPKKPITGRGRGRGKIIEPWKRNSSLNVSDPE
jgi:hypothetical protein